MGQTNIDNIEPEPGMVLRLNYLAYINICQFHHANVILLEKIQFQLFCDDFVFAFFIQARNALVLTKAKALFGEKYSDHNIILLL